MKISVFGGSSPKPGSTAYQQAYQLGHSLGVAGATVLTGGYIGTMEAVSKGAHAGGGHVIGVTAEEIEAWRPIKPNPWIAEEWRCKTMRERLHKLVEQCDAAIALPGGVGTLTEISLTWNQIIVNAIPPKPLILLGKPWHRIMETFFTELGEYVPIESREYLGFAPDPNGVMDLLKSLSIV
jgi:uncharacterized protein (TIGR00730 family)